MALKSGLSHLSIISSAGWVLVFNRGYRGLNLSGMKIENPGTFPHNSN
jgi:hypothetical protein